MKNSINNLLSLKYKIQSLDWVYNVITVLDVPLLNSTDEILSDKLKILYFKLNKLLIEFSRNQFLHLENK